MTGSNSVHISYDDLGTPVCPACDSFLVYRRTRVIMEEFALVDLNSHGSTAAEMSPIINPDPLYSDAVDTLTSAVECADLDCDYRIALEALNDADVAHELN